jgi:hypothetical protein
MNISEMLVVAGKLAAGMAQEIRNPLLALSTKSSEKMTSRISDDQ